MYKFLILIIFVTFPHFSHGGSGLSQQQLKAKALTWVKAKNARQQPNTTLADIDFYIDLLSNSFVDEHIKYNVVFQGDKPKLRASMAEKLKDKILYTNIEVNEIMIGVDVVFIKMTESGRVKPAHLDKEIDYKTTNIVSLEYDENGLIKHIRRHHGF